MAPEDLRVDDCSSNPYGVLNRVVSTFSLLQEDRMQIVETQELVPSCHRPEIVETSELVPTCHT
jgi:hypothetical protein